MTTGTLTQAAVPTAPIKSASMTQRRMKIDGSDPVYGDWRDDLIRDGYAVVKGAIPRDRAVSYADRMYSYLEGL